jgi:hypothetical protein
VVPGLGGVVVTQDKKDVGALSGRLSALQVRHGSGCQQTGKYEFIHIRIDVAFLQKSV